MSSPTPNRGYTYPAHGGSVNAWDTPLNANFDQIDLNTGGSYNIVFGSSISGVVLNSSYATVSSTATTCSLLSSIAQNMYFNCSGALGGTTVIVNFPSGAQGFAVIANNTDANGTLTAQQNLAGAQPTIDTVAMIAWVGAAVRVNGPTPSPTFASGTSMLFMQAAAPSGWTQDTSQNDRLLRIVSDGSGTGTGGQWAISGVSVQNHTLSQSEIPAHAHPYNATNSDNSQYGNGSKNANDGTNSQNTSNVGGGSGHGHGLSADGTWRPNYQNVMRATKN